MNIHKHSGIGSTISAIAFWGYNLVFALFFLLLFLLGEFRPEYIVNIFESVPLNIFIIGTVFFLLPFISLIVGFATKLKNKPHALLAYFFGLEIPLMGLAVTELFLLRQITPIMWLFTLSAFAGVAGLLVYLFREKVSRRFQLAVLLSQEIGLLLSGYVGLLCLFFFPIILVIVVKGIPDLRYMFQSIFESLIAFRFGEAIAQMLLFILMTSTVTFFLMAPIMAILTYWKSFKSAYKHYITTFSLSKTRFFTIIFAILYILTAVLLAKQNDSRWYVKDLEAIRKAKTFKEKQVLSEKLLKNRAKLKATLVNSYLAPYRYVNDTSMFFLKLGYTNELKLSDKAAESLQHVFNFVATPFVYRGNFGEDTAKAAEDYQELFDVSIQEGEKETIVNALKTTNTRDELKAGLLDRNEQNVKLVARNINVQTHNDGLFATVTVEEEYENTKKEIQEVYYEFSLPEDSVITGLALGPDLQFGSNVADTATIPTPQPTSNPNTPFVITPTPRVDTAVVAPKGAAQDTFNQQLVRRLDPALIEQVGPRQYKLRVFPIPIKEKPLWPGDTDRQLKNQKVRYTYVTSQVNGSSIALPTISDQRNVFNDSKTKTTYVFDGQELAEDQGESITVAERKIPCKVFKTQTAAGDVYFIPHALQSQLEPWYSCDNNGSSGEPLKNLNIALLVDISYSTDQESLQQYLKTDYYVSQLAENNNVDLYYFNEEKSNKIPLTKEYLEKELDIKTFGSTNRLQSLQRIPGYELVIMLTDPGKTDISSDKNVFYPTAPVYIVHRKEHKGIIPAYSEELTNYVIQSGGKVVTDLDDVIEDFWLKQQLSSTQKNTTLLDTSSVGSWVLSSTIPTGIKPADIQALPADSYFGRLAEKKLIMESIKKSNNLQDLAYLDTLNKVAQQSYIVTPYSSMIVLVTSEQRELLKELSSGENRYRVDLDTGEEQMQVPGQAGFGMGAVPEPHEWMLIITAFIMLAYLYRNKFAHLIISRR